MKNTKGIMMENTKEVDDGSLQLHSRLNAELKRSEIPRCDEKRDIRDKVVSGEPFTSSAGKRIGMELKGSNGMFPSKAGSDENLHSDTTTPSENSIVKAPQAKDTFTGSAKGRIMQENSKKRTGFEGTIKNKQVNS